MKRLALLRHGKSSWDIANRNDFDRPLNERGWKAARRMGDELKRRGVTFDLCLASPAARVRETMDGLIERYGLPFPLRFDPRLYLASATDLLAIIRAAGNEVRALLLVGHNPGLQRSALALTRDDDRGLRQCIEEKFPTAAFALIDLAADRWTDVEEGNGKLTELILPRELD